MLSNARDAKYKDKDKYKYKDKYKNKSLSAIAGREHNKRAYARRPPPLLREKRNYFSQKGCILRFTVLECNYEARRYSSRTTVPVWPWMPSRAFSSSVMRALRPGFERANFTAASTLGSMEPGAKCPWAMYSSAMAGVS